MFSDDNNSKPRRSQFQAEIFNQESLFYHTSTALKPKNFAASHGQSKLKYSILDLHSVQQFTFQRDDNKDLTVQIMANINGGNIILSNIKDGGNDEAGIFLTTIVELNQGDMVSCEKGLNSEKHYNSLIFFFFKLTSTTTLL